VVAVAEVSVSDIGVAWRRLLLVVVNLLLQLLLSYANKPYLYI
jgi:hypothetical protein